MTDRSPPLSEHDQTTETAPTRRATPRGSGVVDRGDGQRAVADSSDSATAFVVPGRLAGYTYAGAAYCPDCAGEIEIETAGGGRYTIDEVPDTATDRHGFGVGVLTSWDEWDHPGATCFVCHRRIDTQLIVHDTEVVPDV